jgi:preprotein translocase subunit SecG
MGASARGELNMWLNLLNLIVILTALFLIGLVLIQRGKGGGLAGAFGGVGGSSPFGSKAGDAFTKFTIYVAAFWILLIMVQVRVMNAQPTDGGGENLPGVQKTD